MKRIDMVCRDCGSTRVTRDAWAQWDSEEQCWTLAQIFDYSYCFDCEADAPVVERETDVDAQ